MFCKQCGTQLADDAVFCNNCGTKQVEQTTAQTNMNSDETQIFDQGVANDQGNQQYAQQGYNNIEQEWTGEPQYIEDVSFGDAIKLFFQNYVNFEGRATKSEYWWAFLFQFIVSLVASWIPFVGWLVSLALIIPNLSISVRRLHDTGKSWVYLLMSLIPLAGAIVLIIQFCKDSDGDNQWGPRPMRK